MKMLSGILSPTSGEARVLGRVPWKREKALLSRFAIVMGQKAQLWWDLPAADSFLLNKDIYEVEEGAYRNKLEELTELFELKSLLHLPVRQLSLGERMKCELAACLLHSPEILFLDEPTIGLDVVSQRKLRNFLKSYNSAHGLTMLLTSHYMLTKPIRYPIGAYPPVLRGILRTIMPLAFVVTVPSRILLGLAGPSGVLLCMGVAALSFMVSRYGWKRALRRYGSAGS